MFGGVCRVRAVRQPQCERQLGGGAGAGAAGAGRAGDGIAGVPREGSGAAAHGDAFRARQCGGTRKLPPLSARPGAAGQSLREFRTFFLGLLSRKIFVVGLPIPQFRRL